MKSNFEKVKKYMDLSMLIDKESFFKKETMCNPNTCDHQLDVLQNQFLVTEETLKIREKDKIARSFVDLLYDIYASSIVLNIDIIKEFDKVYGTPATEKSFIEKIFGPCMCVDPLPKKEVEIPSSIKDILDNFGANNIDPTTSVSK